MNFKDWLEKFCKDVFKVDERREAYGLIHGGVEGYTARHGSAPDDEAHRLLLEKAGWFVYDGHERHGKPGDKPLLDADMTPEDKRVAVLEFLEKIHGKA
ncbi:hypothetical protein DBR42_00945 [Pelomonas sp. HMWF004]|nr:hypothetical protein DBR42_00945 [Pelomonas sp. HMWF004]